MTRSVRTTVPCSSLVLAFVLAAWSTALAGSPGAAAGTGADWPQWRGPARNGCSADKGLLPEWPAGGPKLAFKARGIGAGYSSITTWRGRLFTMGDVGTGSKVLCMDATGKVLWTASVGKAGAPGWGGFAGPRASVTIAGDLAYAVDQWGELVCVDTSGKERWRKSYTKDFGAKRPEWGFSESPLVDGNRLIVTPGGPKGAVVALDRKTGRPLWASAGFTDGAQYSSINSAKIAGVPQYVQLTMESVVGIGVDGKVLWRAPRKGETAVVPDPVVKGDLVYVTSGYGVGCNIFRVTAKGGKLSADEIHASKEMQIHHGGAVLVGDHVYGYSDNKGWVCQEIATGKVAWREKDKLGKGCVSFADGRLYLRAEDGPGTVALIEASPEGWREHGRFDQPDRSNKNSWTHPVIAGGRLYLRDQDLLLCYDVQARK